MTPGVPTFRLDALVGERERVLGAFLEHEHQRLARACHDLARVLSRGGTLLAWGHGGAATDAAHVAVEFLHPVIVGKRALPALALAEPTLSLARGDDVVLVLCHGPADAEAEALLRGAAARGLLSIALCGAGGAAPAADHAFVVDSSDADVVQEVQETAYHVLWELVHTFFEHPGLLQEPCLTCGDVAVEATVVVLGEGTAVVEREGVREEVSTELLDGVAPGDVLLCHAGVALERRVAAEPDPASFLYPFLAAEETDLASVLADVAASTLRKGRDVAELRRALDLEAVERCAAAIGQRLRAGGRLVTFGNGGSSTDAQDVVADATTLGWPAVALTGDVATITAVANDVGFENAFSRQLIALGRAGDVAMAFSTSGSSANVVAALGEARARGMLTVALAGGDGGQLARLGWLDHLLVAGSDYVPRVQETHATAYHLLLDLIGGRP